MLPVLGNYLALGVLAGLGLLSKYNYAIFLLALVAAMATVPRYRAVLGNARFLATVCVMVAVAAPHALWLADNYALASSGIERPPGGKGNVLSGLGVAATAALAFLTPLWLFSLILGFDFRHRGGDKSDAADGRLLLNLLGLVAVCVVLFVALTDAQQVKDRWYQPLLFFVPLLVAYHSRPSPRGFRIFISLAALFAVLVAFALPARTLLAERQDKYSRPNMPYPGLIRSIASGTEEPRFVLAETKLLGGNARLAFRDAGVLAPTFNVKVGGIAGKGLVICETRHCDSEKFRTWLRQDHAIDGRSLEFKAADMPFNYAPAKKMTIYWAEVRVPGPARPDGTDSGRSGSPRSWRRRRRGASSRGSSPTSRTPRRTTSRPGARSGRSSSPSAWSRRPSSPAWGRAGRSWGWAATCASARRGSRCIRWSRPTPPRSPPGTRWGSIASRGSATSSSRPSCISSSSTA